MKKPYLRLCRNFLVLSLLIVAAVVFQGQSGFVQAQDEGITCPANSYLSGDQCQCNSGYYPKNGACQTESEICSPYGPSHLVGSDCVCNDGYGVLSGSSKCVSLSAACAQYNAIWSASKGDCTCASGLHEDTVSGKCVADIAPTPVPIPVPAPVTTPTPVPTPTPVLEPTPITAPTPTVTTETTPSTTPITEQLFEKVDQVMDSAYENNTPETQAVIEANKAIVIVEVQKEFAPADDLYAVLKADANPVIFTAPIEKSLVLLQPSEKIEVDIQLATLKNFSDSPDAEILIKGEEIGEKLHEASVVSEFKNDAKAWEQEVVKAEKELKLKEGVDQKKFQDDAEMENRLKLQIATLEKIVGYNHLRCLEATKGIQFDTAPKDYKTYFNNQSADNMFEAAAEGQAFEKAARNISGTTKQISELKEQLKKNYPAGWKEGYLNIPAKPTLEGKKKQMENIFVVFSKLDKK